METDAIDELVKQGNWILENSFLEWNGYNEPEVSKANDQLSALKERIKELETCCEYNGDLFDQAEIRIAELEAERTWRPIETAPQDERVLVSGSGGDAEYVGWAILTSYDGYWHEEDSFCLYGSSTPTHWMPLPLPPKEE